MTPLFFIRKRLLGVSQPVLASIAGTTQSTVSRWERGELEPNRAEMARIREAAIERGVEWSDRFFFEVPVREVAA